MLAEAGDTCRSPTFFLHQTTHEQAMDQLWRWRSRRMLTDLVSL